MAMSCQSSNVAFNRSDPGVSLNLFAKESTICEREGPDLKCSFYVYLRPLVFFVFSITIINHRECFLKGINY